MSACSTSMFSGTSRRSFPIAASRSRRSIIALKYGGAPPGTVLDLRFQSILSDLGIPSLGQHDAFNDALMTAMMYVQLRDMRQRGARIGRERAVQQEPPIGA